MSTGPQSAIGVSELTRLLKTTIEQRFPSIWVRGEISNLRKQASGHCYFSLKDSGSQISAVLFRGNALRAQCDPLDGRQVLAFGELSVYEPRGTYQLIVRELIEDGIGRLQREFERLKEKMRAEGLFADSRKKDLPWLPLRVGVVTSASGAAIQDMISVFRRMGWPGILRVFPSPVQGNAAIPSLVRQIQRAGQMKDLDLLVVARGGGSLEDLWCFNDEKVARALGECPVPTLSAVGHETDVVLTDFIADLRKETPTGAAEWISSAVARVQRGFEEAGRNLIQAGREALTARLDDLERARVRTVARPFLRRIEGNSQRLDEWRDRISRVLQTTFSQKWNEKDGLRNRLRLCRPDRALTLRSREFEEIRRRLRIAGERRMSEKRDRVERLIPALRAGGLDHALKRGFALVRDESGTLRKKASDWSTGDSLRIEFHDGRVEARVEGVRTIEADRRKD